MRVRSLLLAAALISPIGAYAECSRDSAPAIPDGSKATEAEMVSAQQALKIYVASGNAYLECLDKDSAAAPADETEEQKAARVEAYTDAYNGAVDEMKSNADSFNAAVRAWKAANAK